jgi:hypothetical protein
MAKVKKKLGRPSGYKKQYCELLTEHMASGLSFESFAADINVHRDTLYDWAKKHKDFSDAKRVGLEKGRKFWETVGCNGATGKIPGFNAAAYIFNMKNRFGWRDKQEVEHIGESNKIYIQIDSEDTEV